MNKRFFFAKLTFAVTFYSSFALVLYGCEAIILNDATNETGKKCAQNAVYVAMVMLGRHEGWSTIDGEFDHQEYSSFANMRTFFEKRNANCFSAKFYKSSLPRLKFFLDDTTGKTIAIAAVLSADHQDKHYMLIHKADQKNIYFVDPYQAGLIPVNISQWIDDMPLDVLFVTFDPATAKRWTSRTHMIVHASSSFMSSGWLVLGIGIVLLVVAFHEKAGRIVSWITALLRESKPYLRFYLILFSVFLLGGLLAGLISFLFLSSSRYSAQSSLVFDPCEIDLGMQPVGKTLSFDFWISNTGEDTCILNDYKSTCSCLDFELSEKSIGPKSLAKASAHLNISNVGKSMNQVLVTYGDKPTKVITLPVKYEGYAEFDIVPSIVNVGAFTSGNPELRSFDLSIYGDEVDISINDVELVLSEQIMDVFKTKCFVQQADAEDTKLTVDLNYLGTSRKGKFTQTLNIIVHGEIKKEYVVQLIGEFL